MLPKVSQAGYIGLTVVVFLILLSMIVYPWKFAPPVAVAECRAGEAVDLDNPEIIMMPPIKNVGQTRLGPTGGWDDTKPDVEYVLIRKNVPIFMKSDDPNIVLGYPDYMGRDNMVSPPQQLKWPIIADTEYLGRNADIRHTLEYRDAGKPGFDVYYPNETGEVELPFETTDRAGVTNKILTLRTEGFLIFVHLDENNQPVERRFGQHIYFVVDFYQDKAMYDTPDEVKGYNVDDMFHCLDPLSPAEGQVISPFQNKSTGKDQLQLEWFVIEGSPGMYSHCKPAVYLYPERKQLVNVKVFPKGELSYTDPPYDFSKGWLVEAYPDGRLETDVLIHESGIMNHGKTQYDYLYYESKLLDSEIKKPKTGWVVKGELGEIETLFNEVLPKLGLNEKEAKDFKDYWLTKLPKSEYYFVGLVDKNQRDYLEALEVTPKPDTSIRFSLYFEMLDQPKVVAAPEITTPKRNGFTLVDWGGMVKLHKDTPFTCSQ